MRNAPEGNMLPSSRTFGGNILQNGFWISKYESIALRDTDSVLSTFMATPETLRNKNKANKRASTTSLFLTFSRTGARSGLLIHGHRTQLWMGQQDAGLRKFLGVFHVQIVEFDATAQVSIVLAHVSVSYRPTEINRKN
jgi:hypothetical protein